MYNTNLPNQIAKNLKKQTLHLSKSTTTRLVGKGIEELKAIEYNTFNRERDRRAQRCRCDNMTDTRLTAAIEALGYALALLRPPPAPVVVFDPFDHDVPFILDIRSGSQAYTDASAPLDEE